MTSKISKKPEPHREPEVHSSRTWQLQAAKAQFSEVFRRARERAPQVVTKQGKEAVVIVAWEEFERLTQRDRQPKSLSKFFAESPLAKVSIDLERKPDFGRAVEL
jgi:prevent-host-death family protein